VASNLGTNFSTADKLGLINEVHEMGSGLDYMNPTVFKRIVLSVSKAFLRGRTSYLIDLEPNVLARKLIQFARTTQRQSPGIIFFNSYARKVAKADIESTSSEDKLPQVIARAIFPRVSIEIDKWGFAMASDRSYDVAVSTLSGFLHVFESTEELRSTALSFLDAADQIDRARTITPTTLIPENYHEQALIDWESQRIADGYLYPPKDEE